MQSSNSMGGMNAASLQDMQQRLQQQFQQQQQQQQPQQLRPQQANPAAAMMGSFPAGVNPQQFAALQQQRGAMNSNTALAMMQQQQQQQQQPGANSMLPNGNNNNAMFQNFAAQTSPMDASTGSSARLMAMAGMGANKPVDNSAMQNMQVLLQQHQQQQPQPHNMQQRPQDPQQQLLLQRQLAATLQKQVGARTPQAMQPQPPPPNSLLAHQQQLIQQMQQQGGNMAAAQQQQQHPQMGGNDIMGMMQQQQQHMTGMPAQPPQVRRNMSAGAAQFAAPGGLGSLDEQRLRMHQQNLLRPTSTGPTQQQCDMSNSGGAAAPAQGQPMPSNSPGHSPMLQQQHHAMPPQQQQQPSDGGSISGMSQQQQQQFSGNQTMQQQQQPNQPPFNTGNKQMTDSSAHSYRSASNAEGGGGSSSVGEQKTFLDGSFNGGWQSNADLPDRRQVIFRILEVIRQMRPDTNRMSSKLPHMAKSLEEHLYRSAQTKEEYMDFSTLRRRLQAIAHGLEMHRSTSTGSMNRSDGSQRGSAQPQLQQQQGSNPSSRGSFHAGPGSNSGTPPPPPPQQNANWSGNNIGNTNNAMGNGSLNSVSSQPHQQQQMMGMNPQQQQQAANMQQASMNNLRQNFNNVNAQSQNANWSNNGNGVTGNNSGVMAQTTGDGISNLAAQQAMAQRQAMAQQQQGMQQQGVANPTFQQQQSSNMGNFGQQGGTNVQQQPGTNQQQAQNASWAQASSGSLPSAGSLRMDSSSSTGGGSTDPQKKKVILQQQQRLLLLRHASKCTAGAACRTKFCSQMVTLWRHMKACRNKNCKTPHCVSSRCVLNHYRICKSNGKTGSCEVCGPVMMKIKQKERDEGGSSVDPLTKDMPAETPNMAGSGGLPQQQSQSMDSSEEAQLKKVQEQQMKLKRQLESLKQLQKKQEELLKQQRRLEMQAQQVQDSNSPQAQQLHHQQLLLQQLQKKCQNQQLILQQEVQMQMNGGGTPLVQPQPLQAQQVPSLQPDQQQAQNRQQAMIMQQQQQQQQQQQHLQGGGPSPPPSSSSGGVPPPKKALRRSSSTISRGKLEGGKGRRGGKGKSLGISSAGAENITTSKKRGSSSSLSSSQRKKRTPSTSTLPQEDTAEAAKVVSQEEETKVEPKKEPEAKSSKSKPPAATGSKDTSLVLSMTKEEIGNHLDSLNKKIRLSSRTVTHKCMPLLQGLIDDPFGWVFHDAVDPVALGLPDYFEVVKTPMHLELVKKKLENAIYTDVESFARDVRLVFENAILYNGESSEVGELAKTMLTKFEQPYQTMVQDVESSHLNLEKQGEMCSLCGTQNRKFEPTVLYCQGGCKMQRIKRHATYHTDRTKQNHWCDPCFSALNDEDPIMLDDGSEVRKRDLQEFKNDALPEEGWVNCDECNSWVHQICALFNGRANKSNARYTCPNCYLKETKARGTRATAKGAGDLVECNMSRAIEKGLVNALEAAYKKRAEELGMNVGEVEKAEGLSVRVLSNTEKKHLVGEEMLERYGDKGCPTDYAVRTKCIAMFQKIHGVDTMLYAVYVYEYGQESAAPNRRRVYISYLDSVQYFEPKCYRTVAYHTILVEYLRYVKNRGFHTAHIWSCPPTAGDDYIFYSHPQHQMTPRDDMLRAWYLRMLDDAKAEGVVLRTTNLYDEYFVRDGVDSVSWAIDSPTCLPYFEGDYIPGEIENIIRREKEKGAPSTSGNEDTVMARLGYNLRKMKDNFIVVHLRSRRFASAVERGDDVVDWKEDSDDEVVKSKRAKITGKDSSVLYEQPKDGVESTKPEKMQGTDIKPVLSSHFGNLKRSAKSVNDTSDVDEPMETELFESRQRFLNYCQATHCQFDELRRAKHSSMMVLYQLHNPAAPLFLQQCGACYRDITHGIRYHCNQCSNFDLCEECYEPVTSGLWAKRDKRFEHDKSHKFIAVDMEATAEAGKSREERQKTLKAHIKLLDHASTCQGPPGCSLHNCQRMKKLFDHVRSCEVKPKSDCRICKRLLSLCAIHARTCGVRGACPVPFCDRIRERNKRLRRQQQLMDDRRRQAQNDLYHTK